MLQICNNLSQARYSAVIPLSQEVGMITVRIIAIRDSFFTAEI